MDATRVKLVGNSTLHFTREIVIFRSSRGWRNTSSTFRLNSGSSSRNKTPLCARLISPGCGKLPPPVMAVVEIVWCGSRNGRLEISPLPCPSFPATECILVVSRLSPNDSGGRMEGRRFASMDFPLPGAPTNRMLCPPAALLPMRVLRFPALLHRRNPSRNCSAGCRTLCGCQHGLTPVPVCH